MVDLFRIRSESELKKRLARKKKKSKSDEAGVVLDMADEVVHGGCLKAQGKVSRQHDCSHSKGFPHPAETDWPLWLQVKSVDLRADSSDPDKHFVAVMLASNAIETHALTRTGKGTLYHRLLVCLQVGVQLHAPHYFESGVDVARTSYLSLAGHRKPVR